MRKLKNASWISRGGIGLHIGPADSIIQQLEKRKITDFDPAVIGDIQRDIDILNSDERMPHVLVHKKRLELFYRIVHHVTEKRRCA